MSQNTVTTFASRAAEEIFELHRVLQAWFRAEGTDDPSVVLTAFDPGFRMVGAAGRIVTYDTFAANVPKMRGSRPGLIMQISDVEVRFQQDDLALVTYRETQQLDGAETQRWSSALLRDVPGRVRPAHLHLQETFCG